MALALGMGSDHSGPSRGNSRNSSSISGIACSSRPPANFRVGQGRSAKLLCCRPISAASSTVTGSRLNSAASMLSSNR
ncbi:hypothetical protein D9M68_458170 [compost metagenome]